MAAPGNPILAQVAPESAEVGQLKKDLEGYRELLLPLNRVLEWEQSYYPAVLVGIVTLLFAIVWYLEPSVLTTFCLLAALICVADFGTPTLTTYLFRNSEWTAVQERQFTDICVRVQHARQHCHNTVKYALDLKREKPKAYLLVLIGTCLVLAWLGSLIDNLLLTYLLVVGVALVPGLRKRGILQQLTSKISALLGGLKKAGQEKLAKPKTN